MTISERLKYVRKMRGFTQESLAAAIGASRGVITNIEYGKVEPQPLVIRAICETLHINEQWLINGKGAMETLNETEKSSRILSEIYNSAKELSSEEQDFILDMIKNFQKHRENITDDK